MKKTLIERYKELVPNATMDFKPIHQWPVVDKTKYCDRCGFIGTYGDGKTWNRCFTHLNDEPKPKIAL